jgi:6-pyruvoyltetrahydropterin/6-carboxytetrahydropterin synthase
MYKISKDFQFSASHILNGLSETHPCSRLHGHNYTITVEIKSETLDGPGFVLDYRRLEVIKKWIDSNFDHHHLNDVQILKGINPTAENIAKFCADQFKEMLIDLRSDAKISAVTVKETDKTIARYEN